MVSFFISAANYKNKSLCCTNMDMAVYWTGMLYLEILSTADFIHILNLWQE